MKITEIGLSNFRAFVAPPQGLIIELPRGENVLVYGKNSAGKSSLYGALRHFFNDGSTNEYSIFTHAFDKGTIFGCHRSKPQT